MWVTTAAIWLVRLPLAYLFGPILGLSLAVIYLSNVADSVVRAVLIWNRYRRGAWQHMKV